MNVHLTQQIKPVLFLLISINIIVITAATSSIIIAIHVSGAMRCNRLHKRLSQSCSTLRECAMH